MKNKNYTDSELVHNESFRRMVKGKASSVEIDYWSEWIEATDENREKAKKAVAKIAGFKLADSTEVSKLDFEKEWSRLYRSTIGKPDLLTHLPSSTVERGFLWIYRVAAILLVGSMVGLGIWLYSHNAQTTLESGQIASRGTITTNADQQNTVTFSNGAKIVLRSNSSLTYVFGQAGQAIIQVNLTKGEAFFSDKNTSSAGSVKRHTFTVTTPDGLVEDIGTEFVVMVEKNGSRIILQDGHVRVETTNRKKSVKGYDMKKGEMITLRKAHIVENETVNPTFYTAWATGFIQFDHTSVRKFARYVEKRFGVSVVIAEPGLANVTMDGAVYFRSLKDLVRSVSAATQVPVYQSGNRDTVFIGNPNNSKKDQ